MKKTFMKNCKNTIPSGSRHKGDCTDHSTFASFFFFLSNLENIAHLNRLNSTEDKKDNTNQM
jgi:hypothetical protein